MEQILCSNCRQPVYESGVANVGSTRPASDFPAGASVDPELLEFLSPDVLAIAARDLTTIPMRPSE